jgi:hypothetical protein
MVPERLPSGEYGFSFYGVQHRFAVNLRLKGSWEVQPYGLIGSGCDLTGRMNCRSSHSNLRTTATGPIGLPLAWPHLMVAACGDCEEGEDVEVRLFLLVSKRFGLLAKSTLFAGRDREDCCSPELYHQLYKIPLAAACPLVLPVAADFLNGCWLTEWSFDTDIGQGYCLTAESQQGPGEIVTRLNDAYRVFLAA